MNLRSGYPLSLIRFGLPYNYPKLEKKIRTDVTIIGGGISGALTAYYLVNAGVDCIVADGRTIGLGSSCASTSLLQYEIDTPLSELINKVGDQHAVRSYQLCSRAIDELYTIAQKIHFTDFNYRQSLFFSAYKKDNSFLQKEFDSRKKNGFKVQWLEEKDIQKQFDFSAPSAILSAQAAQTNAYTFTHALHQYTVKKGAGVYDRTNIEKIVHHKKGFTLQTGDGITIQTKKIVNATGYEAVELMDKKIVDLNCTFAVASEQGISEQLTWKDDALLWNTADPYLYLRTTSDKRIIIGGRDEEFFNPHKRDELLNGKTKHLVKDFNKLFPKIQFKPEFSWTGTFGSTKDGLPFIGTYKNKPDQYYALGYGGNGITFSQIAAEIITDLITGKKNKDVEIFSFERL